MFEDIFLSLIQKCDELDLSRTFGWSDSQFETTRITIFEKTQLESVK